MPGLTYTLKADSTGIEKGIKTARQAVEKFKADVQRPTKGGGMFADVMGGNLAAQGAQKLAGALANAAGKAGELVDAEDQIGVKAEDLSRLEKVFMGSGVTVENLRKSMLMLAKTQQDVRDGSDDAAKKFAELGITASEAANTDTLGLFFKIADGMRSLGDDTKAAASAMDIFGTKNAKLIGGMKAGSEEIKSAMKDAGGVIEQENAKALDAIGDKFDEVKNGAIDGFMNKLGGVVTSVQKGWQLYKKDAEEAKKATEAVGEAIDASKSPKDLADAKKATEEEKKKAWERRKAALDEIASKKAATEDEKLRTQAAERFTKATEKQREKLEETLSLEERLALARDKVKKAQDEVSKQSRLTGPTSGATRIAEAGLAEAQTGLMDVREEQIQRIMGGSTSAAAAQRAERREQRARERAQRILDKRQAVRDYDAAARGVKATKAEMNLQGAQSKDPVEGAVKEGNAIMKQVDQKMKTLLDRLTVA